MPSYPDCPRCGAASSLFGARVSSVDGAWTMLTCQNGHAWEVSKDPRVDAGASVEEKK